MANLAEVGTVLLSPKEENVPVVKFGDQTVKRCRLKHVKSQDSKDTEASALESKTCFTPQITTCSC